MTVPIVFHEALAPRPRAAGTDAAASLIDLGFPCHLACVGCARRPPNPAAYHAARRRLTSLAATCATGVLRAVFFGGDAFALPRSFTALLDEIGEACARRGARFEGTVLSDGTAWSAEAVRGFSHRGVQRYQVALDGRASIHDRRRPLRCSGSSFARIMASLKFQRGDADVVVRVNAAIGVSAIEALVQDMKRAGLLANPNPITVYVAPPASYRDQARSLLDLFTWRETQASPAPRPRGGPTSGTRSEHGKDDELRLMAAPAGAAPGRERACTPPTTYRENPSPASSRILSPPGSHDR